MADPENQQGDRRRPSFSEITPEHLSKELSDLIPPLKINYKDPSEVIRSLSLEMRDAINQTLKFADGLSDTQKKTFAEVVLGAATAISNLSISIGPASEPTPEVLVAERNINVGWHAGISAGMTGSADSKDPGARLRQALSKVSENIKLNTNHDVVINGNDYTSSPVEYEPGPVSQYVSSWLGEFLPSRFGGDSPRGASKELTDAFERAGSEKVNLMTPYKEHRNKPAEQRYGLLEQRGDYANQYAGIRG